MEKEQTYKDTLHDLTQALAKTQQQALTEALLLCETQQSAANQNITKLEEALKVMKPPERFI